MSNEEAGELKRKVELLERFVVSACDKEGVDAEYFVNYCGSDDVFTDDEVKYLKGIARKYEQSV